MILSSKYIYIWEYLCNLFAKQVLTHNPHPLRNIFCLTGLVNIFLGGVKHREEKENAKALCV